MRTYHLHLIRHGLTDGNLKGLYIGRTDLPLCQEGREQIMLLSQKYDYPHVEAVYSSPALRCLETAAIIYPQYTPVAVEDLWEVCFGRFEGKSAGELKNDPDFVKWVSDGYRSTPPEGEDALSFYNRCKSGFTAVLNHMMKTGCFDGAVITHGAVIMNIMAAFSVVKKESFLDWRVDAGSGFTVCVTPQLWMRGEIFEEKGLVPAGLYGNAGERAYEIFDIDEKGGEKDA